MSTTAPERVNGTPPAAAPDIYHALALVMRDTMPVGKDQINSHQRYNFRGIDDLMSAVAGPMRKHGVFIVPQVLERTSEKRGEKMTAVYLTMRYRIYGPAGDYLEATVPGEASDTADKATNKAMSAALKYLLLHVLMVPIDARSIDDGDRDHPANPPAERQPQRAHRAEPGPWETPPPTAPSGPSRDWLAAVEGAASAEEAQRAYQAAKTEGAPQPYLDQLAAAGRAKWSEPQQGGTPDAADPAEKRLRAAAAKAGLANVDEEFAKSYGLPIAKAGAAQLNEMAGHLEAAP
ncbi:MAG TPA: ERF family protein [Asanoa sp.]|nr:ERF family protein [Asanoa sp.]